MKGILLAGGSGTRLFPMTLASSKQLLPVYDKPMVYYPMGILMLAGIRDILIISTPEDLPQFQRLLGDGAQFGIRLDYAEQSKPEGIAQAFHIAADWVGNSPCALALGDNIIYGDRLPLQLKSAVARAESGQSTVFVYRVADPERYGVAQFDESGRVVTLEEKPREPKSNWAVIGLYFYDHRVVDLARTLAPSARGELEITDLNNLYIDLGALQVEQLGRGCAWLDAGTPASLLQAAQFVQIVQERQGLQIGCPEEIAFRSGFMDAFQLRATALSLGNTAYARYLLDLAEVGAEAAAPPLNEPLLPAGRGLQRVQ
jgi:glucose-1-phosphate thymidylyltransferase